MARIVCHDPGVRRSMVIGATVVGLAAVGLAAAGLASGWTARPQPRLVVAQDLPADVQALVDDTWTSFLDATPAQHDCLGPVGLVLVSRVEGGDASYDPRKRLIRIDIPTSPGVFPQLLAHELGHHLVARCDPDGALTAEVAQLQGLDGTGLEWADDPVEHVADAMVEIIVGERTIHVDDIELSPKTLETVTSWCSG